MADIGIDLGTTNSEVAVLHGVPEIIEVHGKPMLPSAVAWDDPEILIGTPAKDNAVVLGTILSVKRHMGTDKRFDLGGKSHSAPEISAMILKELKRAAEERLGEGVDNAVITTPAYFSDAQNHATLEAAKLAGLNSVQLLAEPIAAALAYGFKGSEEIVLVYDFGGGTFDVAVIDCFDFRMLGLDGDNFLGGDDLDRRLMDHLAREVKKQAGVDIESTKESLQLARALCENAKKELSEREAARIAYMTVVGGKPVNVSLKIRREEYEGMIKDLVDRTMEKVESAIAKARQADERITSKADIDSVLLVGGSSYTPMVQRRLAEYFGKPPSRKVNPDLAVALGAAVKTATMRVQEAPGLRKLRVVLDGLPIVTTESRVTVKGKTSPGANVTVSAGSDKQACTADSRGRFSVEVALTPDQTNNVVAVATDGQEERRTEVKVRHDSQFAGEEVVPKAGDIIALEGNIARALGICVSGQDDVFGIVVKEGESVPCLVSNRQYGVTCKVPNTPGVCEIEVFEGDLPYARLNTHLGTLKLDTPATPKTQEPVEIKFKYTEDRVLAITATLVDYPDRTVISQIRRSSPSGEKWHVLERAAHILTTLNGKLRPEQKTRINQNVMTLKDLCDHYRREPNPDSYQKIKQVGSQLKDDLNKAEAAYS